MLTRPDGPSPTRKVSKRSPSPCSRLPTSASPPFRRSSSTRGGASPAPRTPTTSSAPCVAWRDRVARRRPPDDTATPIPRPPRPRPRVHPDEAGVGRDRRGAQRRRIRGDHRRRARPRRVVDAAPRSPRRGRGARPNWRPGDVHRLLDGRPPRPPPRRRPARSRRAARPRQLHGRDRRRSDEGRPAGRRRAPRRGARTRRCRGLPRSMAGAAAVRQPAT